MLAKIRINSGIGALKRMRSFVPSSTSFFIYNQIFDTSVPNVWRVSYKNCETVLRL